MEIIKICLQKKMSIHLENLNNNQKVNLKLQMIKSLLHRIWMQKCNTLINNCFRNYHLRKGMISEIYKIYNQISFMNSFLVN